MIFSLKHSMLSLALLSLAAVAPSIASSTDRYTDLAAKNLYELPTAREKLSILLQMQDEYKALGKTDLITKEHHEETVAGKAIKIFDALIANDEYSSCGSEKDCVGSQVVSNCDSFRVLNRRSLVSMKNDLQLLEDVYGMLTEKQQKEVRKNAEVSLENKKMTRAEQFTKRQTLINRAIDFRKNTKYGKLENALLHTKKVVCHKATRYVTGTAALLALGYLAHRKGLDSAVVSSVSNGAVTAYNTVLSEQAREALELAAQKSCHAVFHGSVFAWNATKKAGQVAVESAKRVGAYVVSFFKRRAAQPVK